MRGFAHIDAKTRHFALTHALHLSRNLAHAGEQKRAILL
jgi:hypothetical protein